MSGRVLSIPPSQGQALCPRGGSGYPKAIPIPGKSFFPKRAGACTGGRLVANISTTSADYSEPSTDTRSHEALFGEGASSSADVRVPVNGNSLHGAAATRDGCREVKSIGDVFDSRLDDDLDYYVPVLGHRVVGVIVSGNYAKLDVDIGAAKLGHLHVRDLLPLDKLDILESEWVLPDDGGGPGTPSLGRPHVVYDEEVYNFEAPEPLVVDIGTVLEMEVVGQTVSGNPLLSARKAAQRLQWDRVMQMKELNEAFQVKILNYNKSGAITTVEGLRAFLPLAEFTHSPTSANSETLESYVGRTLWVTIAFIRESRGNITLSEKDVWIKRNLKYGSLLYGTVTKVFDFGVLVKVNETDIWGLIHVSNITDGRVEKVSAVFEVGEQVKVILVESPVPDRLAFSTAVLESEPGLMLRDKERVFREAEQTVIALRDEHPEWDDDDAEDEAETPKYEIFSKPISNLEWIEYPSKDDETGVDF
jgi:small subunit ribosomal protein S1